MSHSDLDPVHRLILERIPDTPDGRPVRIALLRLLHATQWLELDLPIMAQFIATTLDDPPWSIRYGPEPVRHFLNNIRNLANEVQKTVAALNAAQPQWQRFDDSLDERENGAIGIRQLRGSTESKGDNSEAPF